MELIGYWAISYGFFEDDVQTAYTTECSCAVIPSVVDYIRSVIMARFPTIKKRHIGLGKRIHKTVEVEIHCVCRLPNDVKRPMIQCDRYPKRYHKDCMSLDVEKSYAKEEWICNDCTEMLQLTD